MEHTVSLVHGRPSLRLIAAFAALAVTAIPVAALLAQPQGGPFKVVETGQSFGTLQQAVDAIGADTGSIAIAPGAYRECAVQTKGRISYLAEIPGRAVFDGKICEGKAALVLRGDAATVSGLTFAGMHVPEYNGAGIRIEKGQLTVTQSWFRDSDQGILSAADPNAQIIIDKSTFSRLGTCAGGGGCAHSVYVGDYGALRITRSRFEEGRGGHYVKSRAPVVQLAANSFDDSRGQGTNYMIDLPAGAEGQITNNWFVQGSNKENYSALIAVAAEGKRHPSTNLTIAANDARLAPAAKGTMFVADWSGEANSIGNNRLDSRIEKYEYRR